MPGTRITAGSGARNKLFEGNKFVLESIKCLRGKICDGDSPEGKEENEGLERKDETLGERVK